MNLKEEATFWMEQCWGDDYLSYKPFLQDLFFTEHSPFKATEKRNATLKLQRLIRKYFIFPFQLSKHIMSDQMKVQMNKTFTYIKDDLYVKNLQLVHKALDQGIYLGEFGL